MQRCHDVTFMYVDYVMKSIIFAISVNLGPKDVSGQFTKKGDKNDPNNYRGITIVS